MCLNTPDIAPSLLGLLGVGPIQDAEGMDLSHCLLNQPGPEPHVAFMQGMGHTWLWQDGSEWRAVRNKQYTYARYLCDGSEHLYDNEHDPYQTRNLADDPAHETTLQRMRNAVQRRMDELQDEFQPHTYYRSWMKKDDPYCIVRSAGGEFKEAYDPVPSLRGPAESQTMKEG